jgi:hypothetical protein
MDERDYKAMNEELNQPSFLGAVICSTLLKGLPFFGVFFVDKVWLQWNFAIYILYQILIGCICIMLICNLYGQYCI